MGDEARPHEVYLRLARNDLRAAAWLRGMKPPWPTAVGFHAQQAAEKALKAFLAARGGDPIFTHDIQLLVEKCEAIDERFGELRPSATILTPFAVAGRYGHARDPSDGAQAALDWATRVVGMVEAALG